MPPRFRIFKKATSDDIRVGYIDPEFGYINGVSKCEANEYALDNPGTTFIFETREEIRYLNINEVNALQPEDLPSSVGSCTGIQIEGEPESGSVSFFGGGGVGALANPVIGEDGSLMAVDLIRGGHGYQYPPVVRVTDDTGIGIGAVTRAVLVGDPDYPECDFVETFEVFDQEDDFEDYQICEDPGDDFGERYDPAARLLGEWDPTVYTSFEQDSIEQEIEEYQEVLKELDNPWWTSRKEPSLIITDGKSLASKVKYDVVHPGWGQETEFVGFDRSDNTEYLRSPVSADTFMNKYAISPVPPSNELGSDFDTDTFNIFWEEDFPFSGKYTFEAQGDGEIRNVYVDDVLLGRASDFIKNNKPKVFKKQLEKGVHEIRVELKNDRPRVAVTSTQAKGTLFLNEGGQYYMLAGGNGLIEVDFDLNWDDNVVTYGYLKKITIETENGPLVFERSTNKTGSIGKSGTFESGKKYLVSFEANTNDAGFRIVDVGSQPSRRQQRIEFDDNISDGFDINSRFTISNVNNLPSSQTTTSSDATQSTVIADQPWNVNPLGIALAIIAPTPPISGTEKEILPSNDCPPNPFWTTRFSTSNPWWPVTDNRWSQFMNSYAISPVPPLATENSDQGGIVFSTSWNIDAPYDGFYGIKATVDNGGRILVDGSEVMSGGLGYKNSGLAGFTNTDPETSKVFLSKGEHTITVEVVNEEREGGASWARNPVGISAIMIPPPCPKRERGKGVVCRVLVDDPGNGFASPPGQGYPVGLELQSVEVVTPGINYRCGEDQIIIEPSNGAELTYECDSFGRITKVNVVNPGFGFTRTPTVTMVGPTGTTSSSSGTRTGTLSGTETGPLATRTGPSETGVNATFRPQFRVVRDPIVVDTDTIIQVTDLVGLKQTGYVDGRAYYGAVFYQEGVRYAGYYQTAGQLVQVYDTLQESIDAQVVTPPSAIIRQGTDISSNDPRLNIPGTPDEIN